MRQWLQILRGHNRAVLSVVVLKALSAGFEGISLSLFIPLDSLSEEG